MPIIESIKNGLVESMKLKYIFPFLFLNFTLFSTTILFIIPIMYSLDQMYRTEVSPIYVSIIAVNSLSILIVLVIYYLLKVWFIGALIHSYHKKKDFFDSLERVKKEYLNMFLISLVLVGISALVTLFVRDSNLSAIFIMIVDLLLIFSFQSVVIKKDTIKLAIVRSITIVKKLSSKVFLFWITTRTLALTIFIVAMLLFSPIAYVMNKVNPFSSEGTIYTMQHYSSDFIINAMTYLTMNYPVVITFGFLVMLIVSYVEVFLRIATTDFFVKVSRRKRFL